MKRIGPVDCINDDVNRIIQAGIFSPEEFRKKKILLLGSTGLILSYTARFLTSLNLQYSLDMQLILQGRSMERLNSRLGDLASFKCVSFQVFNLEQGIPDNIEADFIVHGASPANGKAFIQFPVETILPNVLGTKSVLEFAKKKNAKVLYMSSTAIYGDITILDKDKVTEKDYGVLDPLEERASYSESKRLSEQLCCAFSREYTVQACIARIPYTYGPSYDLERDHRFIPRMINKILLGEDIQIQHDDNGVQYTYVGDVASALLLLLLMGESGTAYNVCAMDTILVEDMIAWMHKLSKGKGICTISRSTDTYELSTVKTINQRMDNHKIIKLGWKSCFDFQAGIMQTVRGIHLTH